MTEHNPTPWREGSHGAIIADQGRDGKLLDHDSAEFYGGRYFICESADGPERRRIVACVNACEGINPEALPRLLWIVSVVAGRLRVDGRTIDGITKDEAATMLEVELAAIAKAEI